jgi:hypothetical protein
MIGCMGHVVKPYHYIHSSMTSGVPLKVYHIWIDKNFGAADRVSIDDAIRQWNFALNGYVKLEVVSYEFDMEIEVLRRVVNGDGWIFMKIGSDSSLIDDGPKENGKPKFYTLAWVNQVGGNKMWMVRDRIFNERVMGVTLHEIGHLLGAGHDSIYLMQPIFNLEDYRCVDYETARVVANYQHLQVGMMNYCVYGELKEKL